MALCSSRSPLKALEKLLRSGGVCRRWSRGAVGRRRLPSPGRRGQGGDRSSRVGATGASSLPCCLGLGQTQGSEDVEGWGKLPQPQDPAEPGVSDLRMPNRGCWVHVCLLEGHLWGWAGWEMSSPVVRSRVSCPQWKSGQLVQLGWTASEDLLCIQEDGTILVYNLFCEFKRHFSMGNVSGAGQGAQEMPGVGFVQRSEMLHGFPECSPSPTRHSGAPGARMILSSLQEQGLSELEHVPAVQQRVGLTPPWGGFVPRAAAAWC